MSYIRIYRILLLLNSAYISLSSLYLYPTTPALQQGIARVSKTLSRVKSVCLFPPESRQSKPPVVIASVLCVAIPNMAGGDCFGKTNLAMTCTRIFPHLLFWERAAVCLPRRRCTPERRELNLTAKSNLRLELGTRE
jgi:hypothetical protein